MTVRRTWDVFCSVVDNFGDAGVAWRLARQLVAEHGRDVRLLIDLLPVLARIAPEVDPGRPSQSVHGVTIALWQGPQAPMLHAGAASAVVEAFGCGLPAGYLDAMQALREPPAWINLEYLSAERWVDDYHALPSPQPQGGLSRHFFFPGFTVQSGGLLREKGLLATRDAFQADASARAALWRSLSLAPPDDDRLLVSLFAYANPRLPALLDAWAEGEHRVCCIVPEGVASGEIDRWSGGAVPHPGQTLERGRLALIGIPFVAQEIYDRLLWASDLNLVRGEDSLVRALWAGRPVAWQPYPQAADAQRAKLDAFLSRYSDRMPAALAARYDGWVRAWNGGLDDDSAGTMWEALAADLPALRGHALGWSAELALQPDLTARLVTMADRLV
ncbi:MAG TPA: elongation factor P maturation arginine rhamnosyltransferase EarP [Casimicrobiaceae bacterium]|nr:elongation factor P maturation arginine rhamnosyltransferase EarP [Casimicrobiaceae bacterium]